MRLHTAASLPCHGGVEMAKTAKGPDEPTIKERIVVYMRRREGDHLTTAEITRALGIKRDQATSALHNLAKRAMPDNVRRVGDGVWMYTSTRPLERRAEDGAFSAVGRLSSGKILLVDEEGQLWEAHRVEAT